MCTSDRISFSSWLEGVLKEALSAGELKDSLYVISRALVARYPETKVWFARQLGRRWSYITGAGKESYTAPEKIEYWRGYAVFFENFPPVTEREKELLLALFKLITVIKDIDTK